MLDDNADRARLPGQQGPVPERDIEPLWPADPPDADADAGGGPTASPPVGGAASWPQLTPEQQWGPPHATPPAVGVGAADTGTPVGPAGHDLVAGGRPTAWSTTVPPGGTGTRHPGGPTTGSAVPPPVGPTPPDPPPAVPGPRTGPPVDLDGPFTLDQPLTAPAAAPSEGGAPRGASESPWAHPPQRSVTAQAPEPARRVAPAPRPSPDQPPVTGPLPPAPGPVPAPTEPGPVDPGPAGWSGPPPVAGPYGPHPVGPDGPPHPVGPAGSGDRPHPGPVPPAPTWAGSGWQPSAWQQSPVPPDVLPLPQPETPGVTRVPPAAAGYPDPLWAPGGAAPTAEDFARRRQARPVDPVATMGVRAVLNRSTLGLVKLPPGRHEQELKRDIEMVRRNFGGLRQVTVVNPKGGAGKTVAILLLAMTFGQKRGGYVLAWDNNETQGTLGMRAQQDFHSRTVRDMLRDLGQFQGPHGRVGDLSQYVRSQGEGMFDVLASDESATGGEMLTASAFAEIRDVVSRFYKLIFVDTGNNVRAQNWQAAMDATDQLVVTMSARNDSAETAARMLDHLEQSGRQRLVRQAVTVVSMPPSRTEIDLPAIQEHFAARTRAVLLAPYERLIDSGEPIRYGQLSSATRDAWLKIAAAVAEGL